MKQQKYLQRAVFLLLLAAMTAAFVWVLSPFLGAVFWAVVLAVLFHGWYVRLLRKMPKRRNYAALLILTLIILMVVLPTVVIGSAGINEMLALTQRIRSGEINLHDYLQQFLNLLPQPLTTWLKARGLYYPQDWTDKLSGLFMQGGQFLTARAVNFGQDTLVWLVNLCIMLYLLFFFLRDGGAMAVLVRRAVPLTERQTRALLHKFAMVVRATVKGNVIVALVQGALGGIGLAMINIHGAVLWGSLMILFSLIPAVGAGLIWAPIAFYLLATGDTVAAIFLALWGVLVIGMMDNVLRPLLVGKDTKLPDWMVLLSTMGGISLMGISGFVIGPVIAALFMAVWDIFGREWVQMLDDTVIRAASEEESSPSVIPDESKD